MAAAPRSCSHRRTARDRVVGTLRHAHRSSEGAAQDLRSTRSTSPIAIAWRSAGSTWPRASNARDARSCAARSLDAPERRQPGPQERAEQVVVAEPARRIVELAPRTGWRRSGGRAAPPTSSTPVTAAHSSASKASNTDVSTRKSTRSGGRLASDLAEQEVTDGTIGAGERGEEVAHGRRRAATRSPPAGRRPATPR